MRFFNALVNDVRYQFKYGFYFLYAVIGSFYAAALVLCPAEYKKTAASVIILTDPAMLGTFFIGGIWLLEKREGLHGFWPVSPLKTEEYILSKALSLASVSALASVLIALAGLREKINFPALFLAVFAGSVLFTVMGLFIATYARSVNHYILIASLPAVFFTVPPILAAFGASNPFFEIMPGTLVWGMIAGSLGVSSGVSFFLRPLLIIWFGAFFIAARRRVYDAMPDLGVGSA